MEAIGVFAGLILILLFVVDGGKVAGKNLTEIGEDGGAACGDAVLDKEDGDLGEEGVKAGGGVESGEQAEEGGREVFVGDLELASHMAETEAGGGIEDRETAAAARGSVVAAAVSFLGGRFGRRVGLALPGFGRSGLGKSAYLLAGSDERGEFAGSGYVVDKARVSRWLIHVVPRLGEVYKDTPSVG